ncbi:uncharacterized protein [Panulirus ornatus]|uniref:uncharacterized protein isoform X5 n=1 Tax=Panulirus ornatus TaxID=150431 RepID=UPI003A87452F
MDGLYNRRRERVRLDYLKERGGLCRVIELMLLGAVLGFLGVSPGSGTTTFHSVMTSLVLASVTVVFLAHLLQPRQRCRCCTSPGSWTVVVGLGLVIMHVFLVYKGAVVMFMTNCRLLANAFTTWRNQVARALQDVWSGQETAGVPLKELLEGHWRLVQLVRESEAIYSCMMMVYYASTVVMLCAELYLVAYRLGVGLRYSKEEAVCQTMIIGQTSVTFLLVSLSASAVHDEAEGSVDVVRRGLPYTASDSDKFHMRQLQLAVMGAPIYISGGRFFAIHRPFILTVMSAVASYFIIILQLNIPVMSAERAARDHSYPTTEEDVL